MNDAQELNAISEVYCKNRTKPLLIGSVKSNIGDSEPASGLCGVFKTVLAMEKQQIPATLHYKTPNPRVPALKDGRLQVVNKPSSWTGQYAAVNAVGIGGLNAQALLKANKIEKKPQPQDPIPRLIVGSGRTESAINYLLNRVREFVLVIILFFSVQLVFIRKYYYNFATQVETGPKDPEWYGLLYGVHSKNIAGHNYRGYTILGEETGRETAVRTQ